MIMIITSFIEGTSAKFISENKLVHEYNKCETLQKKTVSFLNINTQRGRVNQQNAQLTF
jgi:hypothetical protein